jgi:hypothetical protein
MVAARVTTLRGAYVLRERFQRDRDFYAKISIRAIQSGKIVLRAPPVPTRNRPAVVKLCPHHVERCWSAAAIDMAKEMCHTRLRRNLVERNLNEIEGTHLWLK